MNILNKIHNLMINCDSTNELKEHVFLLGVDNCHNEVYDALIDNLMERGTLAADCTIIPMYYFKASTSTGMKQDRTGKFYIPCCY